MSSANFLTKKERNAVFGFTFLFGTPDENRTHNCPLGGDCYIHLTTEALLFFFNDSRHEYLRFCSGHRRRLLARTHNCPLHIIIAIIHPFYKKSNRFSKLIKTCLWDFGITKSYIHYNKKLFLRAF